MDLTKVEKPKFKIGEKVWVSFHPSHVHDIEDCVFETNVVEMQLQYNFDEDGRSETKYKYYAYLGIDDFTSNDTNIFKTKEECIKSTLEKIEKDLKFNEKERVKLSSYRDKLLESIEK